MAKTKKAKTFGPKTQAQTMAALQRQVSRLSVRPKQRSAPRKGGLDAAAVRYYRMLSDPCFAPVAHPVYAGGDGGLLARFESEFTLANGPADTCSIVGFVPGFLASAVFQNAVTLPSDMTSSLMIANGTLSPGYAFLQSAASAVRCVSACMQIAWPGSELNRQGQVTMGQCSGALLSQAITVPTSVSAIRPLCHLRTRMPADMCEVKWRPTIGDAEWKDPSSLGTTTDANHKGGLIATVSNLPAGTGVRVRFIATYEWQPKVNQGMASAFDATDHSSNTLDDVINALDRNGPGWAYRVGAAATTATNMYAAYNTARAVGRAAGVRLTY